jgi:hypothetical protein
MQQIKEEVLPLPPVSIQISDEDLVVEDEDTSLESDLIIKAEDNKSVPAVIPTQNEEPKMDENSSAMKSQEKSLEVPTPTQEANYLEDLAKLAEEIDKENKQ